MKLALRCMLAVESVVMILLGCLLLSIQTLRL